jgi:hypothetical protein
MNECPYIDQHVELVRTDMAEKYQPEDCPLTACDNLVTGCSHAFNRRTHNKRDAIRFRCHCTSAVWCYDEGQQADWLPPWLGLWAMRADIRRATDLQWKVALAWVAGVDVTKPDGWLDPV